MTLEQLLSPAVWEWNQANKHLPEEQMLEEFNKWVVDNENQINESVQNNLDEINEYIERGIANTRLLMESADDIDWNFDDIEDTEETDAEPTPKKPARDKDDSGNVITRFFSGIRKRFGDILEVVDDTPDSDDSNNKKSSNYKNL